MIWGRANGRLRAVLLPPVLLLLQTHGTLAQKLGQGPDDGIDFVQVGLALAACMAIAVFAVLFLRKRLRGGSIMRQIRSPRRLRLEETLRVGTQADICIVACDGEELLLASSPRGVKLLRSLGPKGDDVSP